MLYDTYSRNREIVKTYLEGGVSYADLAKEYGISRQRVGYIVKNNIGLFETIDRYVKEHGISEEQAYNILIMSR